MISLSHYYFYYATMHAPLPATQFHLVLHRGNDMGYYYYYYYDYYYYYYYCCCCCHYYPPMAAEAPHDGGRLMHIFMYACSNSSGGSGSSRDSTWSRERTSDDAS